jgi:diguanylate cyclase (GGDEF)-like protein
VPSVTARSVAAVAKAPFAQRGRFGLPSALPYQRASGVVLVALLVIVLELLGRPAALDPAILLPAAVLAGVALGGAWSGIAATVVGGAYLVLYYSQPSAAVAGTGVGRVVASLVVSAVSVWIASYLHGLSKSSRLEAAAAARRAEVVGEFAARLASETSGQMPKALVSDAADLLGADMAVLTVLDPNSGRHIVRAAHGGTASFVGVEVLPGVGITGQAIRERRLVLSGGADTSSADGLNRRLRGKSAQTMAAVAGLQQGRVVASLTVGRADGRPFTKQDQRLLVSIGALMTLALAGSLVHGEDEQETAREQLTGLYNKAYLEAVLEQIIAWRRRTQPDQRPPLAMIMFDIDGFGSINERHGRQVGDAVLRAVAKLLRDRFRASDVVARVGPDSFFVVLNGATQDGAAEAAAEIQRQVRELNVPSPRDEPVVVSISAGCSVFRDGEKPEAMFRSVEAALETARLA